jgi:hypothetical protein
MHHRQKPPIKLSSDFLAIVFCGRNYRVCDGIAPAVKAKEVVRKINSQKQLAGFRAKTMPVELFFPGSGLGVYTPVELPK